MMMRITIYLRDSNGEITRVDYQDVERVRMLPGEYIHPDLDETTMYIKFYFANDETATYEAAEIIKMAID